jgi:uncharacterized protein (TIGR02270 family)
MPTTFRGPDPTAIARAINPRVVLEHAAEAAFAWVKRDVATRAYIYKIVDLARLDIRLMANLRGLRLAGVEGWHACQLTIDEGAGELFAAAWLALGSDNDIAIDEVLQSLTQHPERMPAVVSALAFQSAEQSVRALARLAKGSEPTLLATAVAVGAARRTLDDELCDRALATGAVLPAGRALRAIGQLGQGHRRGILEDHLSAKAPELRLWAAWSLLLLTDSPPAAEVLQRLVESRSLDAALTEIGVDMLARALNAAEGLRLFDSLKAMQEDRLALHAAMAGGWIESMLFIFAKMADQTLARRAGLAFSVITGLSLTYHDLDGDDPEPDDDDPADALLSWPDGALVTRKWESEASKYRLQNRYVNGEAVSVPSLEKLLRDGSQMVRRGVAIELARRRGGTPLYPTSKLATRQARELLGWP